MARIDGSADGTGRRFAIVVARFNDFVTSRLRDGAREALAQHGVAEDDVHEIWVPGAFELDGRAERVTVTIRDADGRVVRTLEMDEHFPGPHAYEWDGMDDAGNRVPPGRYRAEVERVDALADRLRREADRVARRAQLEAELASFERQRAALGSDERALAADEQSHEERWAETWGAIDAQAPDEMIDWLDGRRALVEVRERHAVAEAELAEAKALRAEVETAERAYIVCIEGTLD